MLPSSRQNSGLTFTVILFANSVNNRLQIMVDIDSNRLHSLGLAFAGGCHDQEKSRLRRLCFRRVPDLREELKQFGFSLLKLRAVEGEEVVDAAYDSVISAKNSF